MKKVEEIPDTPQRADCPWDKDQLGRSTWGLLHTVSSYWDMWTVRINVYISVSFDVLTHVLYFQVAAHYPEQPNDEQKKDIKGFFNILSRLYPCEFCAKDFRQE